MPFPILFGTTVTTVLHYRADCDNILRNKNLKNPGPDGIQMEPYTFGGRILFVLLSIVFDVYSFQLGPIHHQLSAALLLCL